MEPFDRRGSANIDDILEELKGSGAPKKEVNDTELNDILAELGLGEKLGVAPASASSLVPQAPTRLVSAPAPQRADTTAVVPQAPGSSAAGTIGAPINAPSPTGMFVPVKPQGEAASLGTERKPNAKKDLSKTTILDIAPEHGPAAPRVGKAAALDKVDKDKFAGDTELLSWFSGEEAGISPKEQKKADRERKKQQAADRKGKKRRGQEDDGEFVEIADAEELIGPMENEPLVWDEVPQDDVVTGSAFEGTGREREWPEGESLFGPGAMEAASAKAQTNSAVKAIDATAVFTSPGKGAAVPATTPKRQEPVPEPAPEKEEKRQTTQSYDLEPEMDGTRVPTAAFTQEFETGEESPPVPGEQAAEGGKSLYLDDMVDDRFREFFSETVIVEREDLEQTAKTKRKKKKSRTALITGEFAKLAEQAGEADEDDFEDYDRPQDAPTIEKDLAILKKNLTRRVVATGIIGVLLLWMGLAYAGILPLPQVVSPQSSPVTFGVLYALFLVGTIAVNFTTIATGLIGLVGEATVDTPPALASVAALLQAVVLLVQALTPTATAQQNATGVAGAATQAAEPLAVVLVSLFGGVAALLLACNAWGKRVRARSILDNFQLASAGFDHSAAYVLDGSHELAYNLVKGLNEPDPTLLVSRPTALVKGFLRQSFSQHWSDKVARILGWVLLGTALLAGGVSVVHGESLMVIISTVAAVLCIGAPLSSSLVSAIPASLLQQSTSKVGAVVPGWSAIEELGTVNVVMAGARDIFPPSSVQLRGIKTFEKERIDLAILYAASVLIEGCDTMRDIFLGVIQGKSDMLYKVESLVTETGRGFTAWVENSRVVIGTREMLQKHDIDPPPIEVEMKYVKGDSLPVYLAVSGKLFAMFVVGYRPDAEVQETLDGLVKSGVSLLVTSQDMNISNELIESVYHLAPGVVKVLARRDLDMLGPLTEYMPESVGVMSHIGTFNSFIGGMRAAAGCAAAERMSGIVQIASVALAMVLAVLLVFSGGLAGLSVIIALLYQLGWTVLISALPFVRRY